MMLVTKSMYLNLANLRLTENRQDELRGYFTCVKPYISQTWRSDLNINNIHNEGVHGFLSKYLLKFNRYDRVEVSFWIRAD